MFCAISLSKKETADLEEQYAAAGFPVVSNNSAHRLTSHVPIIIPEVNYQILEILPAQQQKMGWKNGFIIAKPNCALQSYMLPLR